jgi:hypothetical protein
MRPDCSFLQYAARQGVDGLDGLLLLLGGRVPRVTLTVLIVFAGMANPRPSATSLVLPVVLVSRMTAVFIPITLPLR